MAMIALGWCLSGQELTPPFKLTAAGAVAVVSTPLSIGPSPRDRLALLQDMFDAGVDCIPLAPDRVWPVELACDVAKQAGPDLSAQIARLTGLGQITLAVQTIARHLPQPTPASGRDWLHNLRARQDERDDRLERAKGIIAALTSDLTVPKTTLTRIGDSCTVHLLVPKKDCFGMIRQIEQKAQSLTAEKDLTLRLTGLWLPLAFVQVPSCLEKVLA